MSAYYLYKITNTLNSKVYVGITKNPVKRKAQHFKNRKSHKTISLIKQAIDKYGEDNFSFEILKAVSNFSVENRLGDVK